MCILDKFIAQLALVPVEPLQMNWARRKKIVSVGKKCLLALFAALELWRG